MATPVALTPPSTQKLSAATAAVEAEGMAVLAYLARGPQREPDTEWLKLCSGWTAQTMCSCVFGAGLPEEVCWAEDVGYVFQPLSAVEVDYVDQSATAVCTQQNPHNMTYKAIFRPHLGCVLVEKFTEEEIRAIDIGDVAPPQPPLDPAVAWPHGDGYFPEDSPAGVDRECLAAAAAKQFERVQTYNTRAITVVYKGHLVFEQYATASNVTAATRLLGWSATKSLTQALIGIAVGAGHLDVDAPAPVPEWSAVPGDNRTDITLDEVLKMISGTYWPGDLPPSAQCLYMSEQDCAGQAANHPLMQEPGTHWNYNSGSTYVLSRIALENRDMPELTNYEYVRRAFLDKLRADSMYIEFQANNVFLGGAYGYARARDWARFGQLYVEDGTFFGERILPEGWVEYSRTPSVSPSYGAHFWRNPSVADNLFFAAGFRQQLVYIRPEEEIVITRNAMPPLAMHLAYDEAEFLNDMYACFDI